MISAGRERPNEAAASQAIRRANLYSFMTRGLDVQYGLIRLYGQIVFDRLEHVVCFPMNLCGL